MSSASRLAFVGFAIILGSSIQGAISVRAQDNANDIARARAMVIDADSLYDEGEWAAGASRYEQIVKLNPRDSGSWENLATSYYFLGDYDRAASAYEQVVALSTPGSRAMANTLYNLACARALAGRKERALETLEQAVTSGYENGSHVLGDSDFESLRDDPRFQKILTRLFGVGYTGFDESGPSAEQMRRGVEILVETIASRHPDPYRHFSREEWKEQTQAAIENAKEGNEVGYYADLQQLAGMVGDVHTSVFPLRESNVLKDFFDISVWDFDDGLYIRAAGPPYERLVGAKILAVQGIPADDAWATMMKKLPTENEWMSSYTVSFHMQFPAYLHALGLGDTSEKSRWTLLMPGGEIEDVDVVASNSSGYLNAMNLSLGIQDTDGWTEGHDALSAPPLWLKNRERNYWYEHLEDEGAVYMQFALPRYDSNHPYEPFLAEMFGFIREHDDVDKLVIDLRLNGGGWDYMIHALINHIVQTPKIDRPGHLFVLMGRLTQSAGVTFVVKMAPVTHAIFVGEPVGAHPNYFNGPWGNHPALALPGTDIVFRISTIVEQQSDSIDNRHYIAPDIPTTMTYANYATGRDPALEAALRLTEEEGKNFFVDAGGREIPLYLHWRRPSQSGTQEHR
jgi:tetratricopeptide (TPR) repeat protein